MNECYTCIIVIIITIIIRNERSKKPLRIHFKVGLKKIICCLFLSLSGSTIHYTSNTI